MAFDLAIDELDEWLERLMQCKPLTENEVKKLCDKVRAKRRAALHVSLRCLQPPSHAPRRCTCNTLRLAKS